jgi:hypothetical protein
VSRTAKRRGIKKQITTQAIRSRIQRKGGEEEEYREGRGRGGELVSKVASS